MSFCNSFGLSIKKKKEQTEDRQNSAERGEHFVLAIRFKSKKHIFKSVFFERKQSVIFKSGC